jgi:hypothetical protein
MKTLIEMAREAGFEVHERKQQARVGLDAICGINSTAKLERFAELIREDATAKERYRCSQLAIKCSWEVEGTQSALRVEALDEAIRSGVQE